MSGISASASLDVHNEQHYTKNVADNNSTVFTAAAQQGYLNQRNTC